MKTKKMKRLLALLLVVCMISAAGISNFGNAKKAEASELTHLTFQDFGIADHATENAYGSTYGWSTWDKMEALLENGGSIREHITVTAMDDEVVLSNNGILFFSNMNDWDGIKLRFDVPNDRLYFEITSSLRNGEAMPGDSAFAITPADVGRTESFYSSEKGFELKLTFEPSGDNGEDLLVSVYVDGVQFVGNDADVVNGVITIPNAVTVIKASKGNTNSERNSVWCQLPNVNLDLVAEHSEGEGEITSPRALTFKDFGIADHATENAYGSTYGWSSWEDMEALLENGGSISEHITFTAMDDEVPLSNNGILFFSNMNAWDGIKMMFDTANDQLYCQVVSLTDGESMSGDNTFAIKPADVGRTESFFNSTGFELKLAFTPAANGEDLMLSIYIDGVQYMGNADADVVNGVITIPNAISVIKASKGQTNWERNSIWCMLPDVNLDLVAPRVENDEEITALTFRDFGIADHATENAYGSTYGWSSWEDMEALLENGGSISEHITFTAMDDEVALSNNGILFFSNMNAWDGIKMMFDTANDQLYCQVVSLTDGESMSGDNTFSIKPADVGRTESFFSSTGFELKLAFTPAANGEDLMLSIYIDGVQYMGNADADVVNGVITIPNAISVIKASKGQTGWERNSIWCMLPDVNLDLVAPGGGESGDEPTPEFSFFDFEGLEEGAYPNLTLYKAFEDDISALLNGGMLRQKLEVFNGSNGGFIVLFSNPDNPWQGIQLRFNDDGSISVSVDSGLTSQESMSGDRTFTILPHLANRSTFLNTKFEIGFKFKTCGENNEDLEVRIYIDGQPYIGNWDADYSNGVMVLPNAVNVIASSRQNVSMLFTNDGVVTLYDNEEEETEKPITTVSNEYYNLVGTNGTNQGYLIAGEGNITVNGVTMSSGEILSVPGDYVIRCVGTGSYEKHVYLYVSGQAHPDDTMDIRDLVAVKKLLNGVELTTKSGTEGADVDRNGLVDTEDYNSIVQHLLETESIVAKADNYVTFEKDVMPIAGYYGPYRTTDKRGNEYDLITDEIYAKLSELGINLIVKNSNNYLTDPESVLKNLALAEKYGMGVFLSDSRMNNISSDTNLKDYFKLFAQYSSFKGISIVDEPSTEDFGHAGSSSLMQNYVGQSIGINKYSNTLGYINLFPRYSTLSLNGNVNEDYRLYLKEYIDTCNPKVISYDHYLFDRYVDKNDINTETEVYFKNMELVREASLESGIPFWTYVQAGSNWNDGGADKAQTTNNKPSKSQMFWNVNTALAYGAKGIQYFPLVQPAHFAYQENNAYDYNRNGLLGANGEKTQWYDYAKLANQQIAEVDEVLLKATSKKILWTGYDAEDVLGNKVTSDGNILKSITTDSYTHQKYWEMGSIQIPAGTETRYRSAIVGVFDYQGKTAYYVVNYDMEATRNITLNFNSSQTYSVISTQLATAHTATSGNTCNLNLIAGGAALVIIE